jgi:hypothetical protein
MHISASLSVQTQSIACYPETETTLNAAVRAVSLKWVVRLPALDQPVK